MTHKTKTLQASALIEDFSLYPRNCVYDGHVNDLVEAIRAGAVLPPIVADAASKRITDGMHRRRARVKHDGPEALLEVTLIEYASEADMVKDAIVRNASHGRRLTTADIARCTELAKRLKFTRDLPEILHVTRAHVKELTARRFARSSDGKSTVLLRRAQEHLAGQQLTKEQEAVATHVGGLTAMQHVTVLLKLITSKSLPDDEKLFDKLRELRQLLEEIVK